MIKSFSYTDEPGVYTLEQIYNYTLYGDWPTQPITIAAVALVTQLPTNTIRYGTDSFTGVSG